MCHLCSALRSREYASRAYAAGRIQNTEYRIRAAHTPPPSAHVNMHHVHMRPCICGRQNTEYRIQNPGGPHPSVVPPSAHVNMHHMHMRPAEYRIQNTESRRPPHPSDSPVSRIQNPTSTHVPSLLPCICITCTCRRQNTECRIQNAEYRMRAGPAPLDTPVSRIQNPESGRPSTLPPTAHFPEYRIQNLGGPHPSVHLTAQFPESRIQNPGGPHRPKPPTDSRIQHPESRGGPSGGPRAEGRILVETEPDSEPEARGGEIESAALILYSDSPLIWEKPQNPGSAEQVLFPHPQPLLTVRPAVLTLVLPTS